MRTFGLIGWIAAFLMFAWLLWILIDVVMFKFRIWKLRRDLDKLLIEMKKLLKERGRDIE